MEWAWGVLGVGCWCLTRMKCCRAMKSVESSRGRNEDEGLEEGLSLKDSGIVD